MTSNAKSQPHWRRLRTLYLLLAVALAPVIASYLAFYVFPPSARSNYGTLIEPRPLPALDARTLRGAPADLKAVAGKWTMVMADGGACAQPCVQKLFQMRQQQAMTGRDGNRIARLWLITDEAPLPDIVLRAYEGTLWVRVRREDAERFLTPVSATGSIENHIWMIDPLGNLMLRWPAEPDPSGVKRDIARLLRASSHWVRIERSAQ